MTTAILTALVWFAACLVVAWWRRRREARRIQRQADSRAWDTNIQEWIGGDQ